MATFTMPSLGADMDSGTLLEWLVKPGDTVHRGDVVAVVDTSKAAVEVETFADGVVEELLVPVGTHAAVGTPLARIGDGVPVRAAGTAAVPGPTARAPSPPVRHLAHELGIDLASLHGTGAGGAVTRRDVERAAASAREAPAERGAAPATPAATPSSVPTAAPSRAPISPYARRLARELGVDLASLPTDRPVHAADVRRAATGAPTAGPAAAAPAEVIRPEPTAAPDLRHTIAQLMSRSKREVPHYYLSTTVDLHAAIAWMTERNLALPLSDRLVPAALFLKATALAARAHPQLNGFWVDETFRPGPGVHLGVAISLRTGGLVAPAIHDAADLGVEALMVALRDLVGRTRAGRLRGSELADPTLTVTNLGDQGVEAVLGVIYPPQVALVGFGRVVERPVAVDGLLGVHPTTTVSLSADHRATDGFVGARFLDTIDRLLQRPEEL